MDHIDKRVWIGLSTSRHWIARAIKFFTREEQSHSWVSYWDEALGCRMVIEQRKTGIGGSLDILTWDKWAKEDKDKGKRTWVYCTDLDLSSFLHNLAVHLGIKYDFKAMFWFAAYKYFGRWMKSRRSTPGKWMCTESIIRSFWEADVPGSKDLNPETTTPGQLNEYLLESEHFYKIDVDL